MPGVSNPPFLLALPPSLLLVVVVVVVVVVNVTVIVVGMGVGRRLCREMFRPTLLLTLTLGVYLVVFDSLPQSRRASHTSPSTASKQWWRIPLVGCLLISTSSSSINSNNSNRGGSDQGRNSVSGRKPLAPALQLRSRLVPVAVCWVQDTGKRE